MVDYVETHWLSLQLLPYLPPLFTKFQMYLLLVPHTLKPWASGKQSFLSQKFFQLFLCGTSSSPNSYQLTACSPFISACVCSSNRPSLITSPHSHACGTLISFPRLIFSIAIYNIHCFFHLLKLLFTIFIVNLYYCNRSTMRAGTLSYV